jgi:RNA polymerase primary sigma factor
LTKPCIKFISYAVWWIRQAILQALAEQSRIVRVPLNRAGTLHRIGALSPPRAGREPTLEELAGELDRLRTRCSGHRDPAHLS